jgi:hypothetical protein
LNAELFFYPLRGQRITSFIRVDIRIPVFIITEVLVGVTPKAIILASWVVVVAPLGEVAPFCPAMTGSALKMFPTPAHAEGCGCNDRRRRLSAAYAAAYVGASAICTCNLRHCHTSYDHKPYNGPEKAYSLHVSSVSSLIVVKVRIWFF